MPSIPKEVIEAVLKHHDVLDVVGRYVHLTKQGKYYKGLCPFHSEKTPSFTVTPERQFFYCYGCGVGGNVIKFMMEMEGISFPEAVRMLAEEANISLEWVPSVTEPTREQRERNLLLEAHDLSAKWYHYILYNTTSGKKAMEYLRQRGFSDKLINDFQIGYAPSMWDKLTQFLQTRNFPLDLMEKGGLVVKRSDGEGFIDRFRDRIVFPIHNMKGQIVGFAARALENGVQPKYLNSPETTLFSKSKNLYNFHQARAAIRKTRQAVLFEGYVDVMKAWEAGIRNGVGTMGTALTEEQADVLRRNADRVILCYDGDDAGQSAANKNLALLEKFGLEVRVAMLPKGLDPDEFIENYGADRFKETVESAVPATKFRLLHLRRVHPPSGEDGKLKYIQAALRVIAPLVSPTEREHYLRELAEEFQYSADALKQELHQIREDLQKLKVMGDNPTIAWNNVMNDRKTTVPVPTLLPAFHNAERKLLAQMIRNRNVAAYVEEKLADQFNIEAHAAIAAYLYAYFAEGNEPDESKFLASLENDKLENIASSILMGDDHEASQQVIDDYIREIKKYPQQMKIEQKKEAMIRAERAGNVLEAAQIANEILALERQLKTIG